MRRVVVFGASGFIGRALVRYMESRTDLQIVALSSMLLRETDVTSVVEALDSHAFEVIVLAMGLSRHANGFHELYEGNVMPTVRLASALERMGRRQTPTYILGSAAELGQTEAVATESDTCRPHTDYGRSKWFQTQFALLKNCDGFRFSVLRLFNLVGVGMNGGQVPECFLRPVLRGEPVLHTGALEFQRDYMDVRDAASAITSLIEADWHGDLLQVCTGQGTTAGALLREVLRQTGRDVSIQERTGPAPGNYHNVGNPSQMEQILGRRITWSVEQCITELIAAS